jgi:hypothetical protein
MSLSLQVSCFASLEIWDSLAFKELINSHNNRHARHSSLLLQRLFDSVFYSSNKLNPSENPNDLIRSAEGASR